MTSLMQLKVTASTQADIEKLLKNLEKYYNVIIASKFVPNESGSGIHIYVTLMSRA